MGEFGFELSAEARVASRLEFALETNAIEFELLASLLSFGHGLVVGGGLPIASFPLRFDVFAFPTSGHEYHS
jgi:hypothetical protein